MFRFIKGIILGILISLLVVFIGYKTGFLPIVKIAVLESREYTKSKGYKPGNGFVQDEETAKKIAEAVWLPIYGKDIEKEKPFVAVLNNDVWTVKGTLPRNYIGGVAEIQISKDDGKILRVIHGQ